MSLIQQINEKKQRAAALVAEGRAQHELAVKEKRDLSTEERESWDKRMADVAEIKADVERLERQKKLEDEYDIEHSTNLPHDNTRDRKQPTEWRESWSKEFGSRFTAPEEDTPEGRERARRCTPEYQRAFRRVLAGEQRALQADVDTAGGYTYADEQFVNRLIQAVDDQSFMRKLATKFTVTNADSLGFPSLDADPADPVWTSELGTGDEDSTMAFGKRSLTPHPLAKRIKVSRTLLRKSALGIEALVRARFAYKFGTTEENAFLNGSGVGQPLGVFTASADGIPTTRDVATAVGAVIDGDDLIDAKYSIKGNYWSRLSWILNRVHHGSVAKLKDGSGNYMWRESLTAGEPDRLLGHPVHMSEFSPTATTTGVYAAVLGDFSYYWIADALTFQMQRLDELYAVTNQVGFIARLEVDGAPVLGEAFARLKFL